MGGFFFHFLTARGGRADPPRFTRPSLALSNFTWRHSTFPGPRPLLPAEPQPALGPDQPALSAPPHLAPPYTCPAPLNLPSNSERAHPASPTSVLPRAALPYPQLPCPELPCFAHPALPLIRFHPCSSECPTPPWLPRLNLPHLHRPAQPHPLPA